MSGNGDGLGVELDVGDEVDGGGMGMTIWMRDEG